ncbi:MAG: hypothetical protein ABIH22_02035 [Candidatus Margulisiibacteriota bacterium]
MIARIGRGTIAAATLILAMSITGNPARRSAPKYEEALKVSKYPDLKGQDRVLVDEYLKAYENSGAQPSRYLNVRGKLLSRMRDLQTDVKYGNKDKDQQLATLAKLVDFNLIMRKTYVAPGSFADQSYQGAGLTAVIPEEVKPLLEVEFKGQTFANYVARHVSRVFFVERLSRQVKILNSDRFSGTCDGATRSVIIDTYQESEGKRYENWLLAAALVHEAAHIDRFYRFANDPVMQEKYPVERYAYIVERAYLRGLLVKVENDPSFSGETKRKMVFASKAVLGRIRQLNQKLRFAADDFSLEK